MKKIFSYILLLVTVCLSSCVNEENVTNSMGYIKLNVTTYTSSVTRAAVPNGYAPKTLAVEFVDGSGKVTRSSADLANDNELTDRVALKPGSYTVNVHSANWDGDGSGFGAAYYAGSTTVEVVAGETRTAKVTCTLANVQVDVVYDQSLNHYFTDGGTIVTSGTAKRYAQEFKFNAENQSAYFPADALNFTLSLKNMKGETKTGATQTISDIHPRDHYTVTYSLEEKGWVGGEPGNITVKVNDEVKTYTFVIPIVTTTSVSMTAKNPAADMVEPTTATLKATLDAAPDDFDEDNLSFEYKLADATVWSTTHTNVTLNGENITAVVTDLTPKKTYEARFVYMDDETPIYSNVVTFSTPTDEPQEQLFNAGFEEWYQHDKKVWYADNAKGHYWDSSNPGSAGTLGESGNVTTPEKTFVHSGSSSAKLASKWVQVVFITKFAAASLFTGSFVELIGTSGAKLKWGVPFTSRPSALKGYLSYNAPAVNRGTRPNVVGAPNTGENDYCQIFCALVTEEFKIANVENSDAQRAGYELSTAIDWENDPRVVAYGELSKNTSTNGAWESFNIPLIYHSATTLPTHLIIVCSSSKYGDYFYGSDSSVLYLDDFEFEYGERTIR